MKRPLTFFFCIAATTLLIAVNSAIAAPTNLISVNAGFEEGVSAPNQPKSWEPIWSREPGLVTGAMDSTFQHEGANSYRIDSTATLDWSFAYSPLIAVTPNQEIDIKAWLKCKDCDDAEISVVEHAADGSVLNWQLGNGHIAGTVDWTDVSDRFIVDPGCTNIQFRLTGRGKGTVWIDDVSLTAQAMPELKPEVGTHPVVLSNPAITVTVDPAAGYAMEVQWESGTMPGRWHQLANTSAVALDCIKLDTSTARIDLVDRATALRHVCLIHLDPTRPEIRVRVVGDPHADQVANVEYPTAFATTGDDNLDIPNNEGVLYPAGDRTVQTYTLPYFVGHVMSMSWFGQYNQTSGAGVMTIVETPDDATLNLKRDPTNGLLYEQLAWNPSKGTFGYDRLVDYVFFSRGGYVAHAKRYRAYAEKIGLVRTLAQKRQANANVDKLIGAADIWDWDRDNVIDEPTAWKAAGLDRVLWANEESPDVVDKINALGYLSGRYDIYQDEYGPDAPAYLPKSPAWPNDLVIDKSGQYIQSWVDYETGPNGKRISYVADAGCSVENIKRAEHDIPLDLATHHYTARFIDTITASPWRECYSPVHPTTRSQDKAAKMRIMNYVCASERLVTGSETGNDCAIPFEDYFEGMESLSQYRLPGAGYGPGVYEAPTPDFLKYQIGYGYRIPLFELVYHDCMVSTWYWGDASNQEPEVWNQRDLWNILYGTNPIYVLDTDRWAKTKARLVQSYNNVSTADRAVGYAQMLDHSFLTDDKSVQQTTWSNGVKIIVNFGEGAYKSDARDVPAGGFLIVPPIALTAH